MENFFDIHSQYMSDDTVHIMFDLGLFWGSVLDSYPRMLHYYTWVEMAVLS